MQPLFSAAQFDAVLDAPVALVFKHSTRCPISTLAYEQICDVADARPDAPIYLVDVIAGRAVSQHVAARLHVTHQSPQAILLVRGAPVWAGSHFEVQADVLLRRLDAALAAAEA